MILGINAWAINIKFNVSTKVNGKSRGTLLRMNYELYTNLEDNARTIMVNNNNNIKITKKGTITWTARSTGGRNVGSDVHIREKELMLFRLIRVPIAYSTTHFFLV